LASGLLWLSEIIEEHSRLAKHLGVRAVYVIMALHVLLWIGDSLPLPQILFSIFCHFVYLSNFTPAWPLISLSSFSFISSCILVLADHFVWFFYFSNRTQESRHLPHRRHHSDGWILPQEPTPTLSFFDIATFFGICVWLVPLFLFLSLSANDNALPVSQLDKTAASRSSSLGPGIDDPDGPSPWIHSSSSTHPFINSTMLFPYSKPTIFQQIAGPIRGFLPSLRRGRQSSRDPNGIIAPHSPGGTRILPSHSNALRSYPTSPSWSHGSDHQFTPPDRLSVDSPKHSAFQHEASARGTPFLASPPRRSTTGGTGRLAASASGASPRPRSLGSRIPLQRSGSMATDTRKDQSLLSSSEGRSESPDTSGF